jgi:hypothetical protein
MQNLIWLHPTPSPSLLINKKGSKNLILVNTQYRDGYLFGYNLIKKMKPRKSRNLNKKISRKRE